MSATPNHLQREGGRVSSTTGSPGTTTDGGGGEGRLGMVQELVQKPVLSGSKWKGADEINEKQSQGPLRNSKALCGISPGLTEETAQAGAAPSRQGIPPQNGTSPAWMILSSVCHEKLRKGYLIVAADR